MDELIGVITSNSKPKSSRSTTRSRPRSVLGLSRLDDLNISGRSLFKRPKSNMDLSEPDDTNNNLLTPRDAPKKTNSKPDYNSHSPRDSLKKAHSKPDENSCLTPRDAPRKANSKSDEITTHTLLGTPKKASSKKGSERPKKNPLKNLNPLKRIFFLKQNQNLIYLILEIQFKKKLNLRP